MIRVLLADDNEAVRSGVAEFLSGFDDIRVVGAASDGAEAVTLSGSLEPDVVLMDLSMPRMDGFEATRRILAAGGSVRVIAFTVHSERKHVIAAIDAGAAGYLLKGADPAELGACLFSW